VQPLEPPRQQRQLVLSRCVELLIWYRHLVDGLALDFPFKPPMWARL
jgi:hypothetical protein